MGQCCYCHEKIKPGEDFVLEGQYPGMGRRRFGYLWWHGVDNFGSIYHRTCFLKLLATEAEIEAKYRSLDKNFLKRFSEKTEE